MISIAATYVSFFNKDIIKIIEYVHVHVINDVFFFLNSQESESSDSSEEEVDAYQQLVASVNGNQHNNIIGQG